MGKGGPILYPQVVGEFDTIRKIIKGYSIARFGDGEVKMMDKNIYTRELSPVPGLAKEMKEVAASPHAKCLIGIPTMDPAGSKYANWQRHIPRFTKYFHVNTGIKYYSALITRPDCGSWLETREYYELICQIWAKKSKIAIVSEKISKLLTHVSETHNVSHVECPMYGAYAHVNRLEQEVLQIEPDLALLSAGPTATILANRLSSHGIQAVDIGSIGGFLQRWRAKEKLET